MTFDRDLASIAQRSVHGDRGCLSSDGSLLLLNEHGISLSLLAVPGLDPVGTAPIRRTAPPQSIRFLVPKAATGGWIGVGVNGPDGICEIDREATRVSKIGEYGESWGDRVFSAALDSNEEELLLVLAPNRWEVFGLKDRRIVHRAALPCARASFDLAVRNGEAYISTRAGEVLVMDLRSRSLKSRLSVGSGDVHLGMSRSGATMVTVAMGPWENHRYEAALKVFRFTGDGVELVAATTRTFTEAVNDVAYIPHLPEAVLGNSTSSATGHR